MAFNPGGITYADPFGAFLTGNVIGREQNRADDQLAIQQAGENRQQDQFDWAKTLRGDQEVMSRENAALASLKNAQERLALGLSQQLNPLAVSQAQRQERMSGLNETAAQMTTIPAARLAQAVSNTQLQTLPDRTANELSMMQAALQGQRLGNERTAAMTRQSWMDRYLTPTGFNPDGSLVLSGADGKPFTATLQDVVEMRKMMAGANYGLPLDRVEAVQDSIFPGGAGATGAPQGTGVAPGQLMGDWGGPAPAAAPQGQAPSYGAMLAPTAPPPPTMQELARAIQTLQQAQGGMQQPRVMVNPPQYQQP